MNIALELLFGMVEVFGTTMGVMFVFRLPVKQYLKEILFISFITSVVALVHYNYTDNHKVYNEISALAVTFLMYKKFLRISYWKAALLSVVGYGMLAAAAYVIFFLFVSVLKVATVDQFFYEPQYLFLLQTFICLTLSLMGLALYKKGWGFTLLKENMLVDKKLRKVTMLLIAALVFSMITIEIAITVQKTHFFMLELIGVNVVLWLVYKRAYKEMQVHYERFDIAAMTRQIK